MKFGQLLDRFSGASVLVVGDLMLDEYIYGRAARVSPEAPVLVIRHQETRLLPGGAANVARNVAALGAQARVAGIVGCDASGDQLSELLNSAEGFQASLIQDAERSTTRKTRILADHAHQVLRVDAESEEPLAASVEDRLIAQSASLLDGCQALILSDYLKGALTARVARELVAHAKRLGIPAVANPKPRSIANFAGASLVSLNRFEAQQALGMWQPFSFAEAAEAALRLKHAANAQAALITLGEGGMAAAGSDTFRIEAPKVEVYDTAGAGDTVIATVALGLATAGFDRQVFELAAQTAACVVRHVGVSTPSAEDLQDIRQL
jgi:rfaE bifunctional protein kinase chain/domain